MLAPLKMAGKLNGCFQNEKNNYYEYSKDILNEWDIEQGANARIFVLDGTRPAIIKKTIAKIMIDENVWETWRIKNHTIYC